MSSRRISNQTQTWVTWLMFLAATTLLSAPQLQAQALSGITGTVTDKTGAVVSGASVTATNDATKVASHAVTSSAGTYNITDLIPGVYTVKIEKANFETSVSKGVNVEVGRKASVDTSLQVGKSAETLEVTAAAIALETEQPEIGASVENKMLEELPQTIGGGVGDRGRQIDNFLFLTPGVQGGAFSHRINGGVDFENEVAFNGVAAVQSETKGFQSNINPPYEMVNEFRVLSSVFSAQYGLAQGVANYQFASGTNALHGDGFEILRNDMFDAPGAFPPDATEDITGVHNKKVPVDKLHNYGFSVGGPVYLGPLYDGRNKTFFYVSSEWYRHNHSQTGTMTVPTPAEIQGDFSNYRDANGNLLPIFVPAAWASNPALIPAGCAPGALPGAQFPGNMIPQSCFSPLSKTLLPLIPAPTFNQKGFGDNISSQVTVLQTLQTSWGFSIDHSLTQKQKLHGSFYRDSYNLPSCCDNNALFSNALSGEKQQPRLGTGFFLTYSNALSNNLVMTAGMGWLGEINDELNSHRGVKFPGVVGGEVLPRIQFVGPVAGQPTTWGSGLNGGETFSINRKLGLSFANNWLWTHGRHTFNFGAEIRRAYQDDHECQQCAGNFAFSTNTTSNGDFNTSDPLNNTNTGSAFASFLLGNADSAKRLFASENKLRNFYLAPYIQDNIKITSRLTVDAGLRWDIMRPFTENSDNVVFFDPRIPNPGAINPVTGQPLLGAATKLGTCPGCAGFHHADTQWNHFSPRLGFAYKLNDKTVILGGFALNFLEGGAFEFGDNKVSVNYGSLLAGLFNINSNGNANPGVPGLWDNNPIPIPGPPAFGPTIVNGTGILHQFSRSKAVAPYSQAWNIGIQRELPWNMFASASYVGNRVIHLPSMMNPVNQTDPRFLPLGGGQLTTSWTDPTSQAVLSGLGFGSATVNCPATSNNPGPAGPFFTPYVNFACDYGTGVALQQALLPFPMYNPSESCGGLCNNFDMNGTAAYNALQLQGQKRFSNGLSFLVAYTLSKTMANTDTGFATFNFGSLNKFNQKPEWSIAGNDQTHLLNISTVYELPIGPSKKFLNGGGLVARNILGGWQLSGVFQYSSGTPNSIIDFSNDPFLNGFNRGNVVPGAPLNINWGNYYVGKPIFNPAAFTTAGFAMGNSPRVVGALRNRYNAGENIGVAKHFYFGERVSAELRMEFYNVLNRMQMCNPDFTVSDSNFGLVSGGNRPCQQNTPRQGQAYFKISF